MATKKTSKSGGVKIVPLADRILIEELIEEKQTASGIILPDSVSIDKGMKEGKVIAVGDGRIVEGKKVPVTSVEVGDKVLFQWGDEIKIDGREYYLVKESEISAKIK